MLHLVFLYMSIQVGLLAKTAITHLAFERLFLVVDISDVSLQIGADGERAFTILALKMECKKIYFRDHGPLIF